MHTQLPQSMSGRQAASRTSAAAPPDLSALDLPHRLAAHMDAHRRRQVLDAAYDGVFFYDKVTGYAELGQAEGGGDVEFARGYSDPEHRWNHIVPGAPRPGPALRVFSMSMTKSPACALRRKRVSRAIALHVVPRARRSLLRRRLDHARLPTSGERSATQGSRQRRPMLTIASTIHAIRDGRSRPTEGTRWRATRRDRGRDACSLGKHACVAGHLRRGAGRRLRPRGCVALGR